MQIKYKGLQCIFEPIRYLLFGKKVSNEKVLESFLTVSIEIWLFFAKSRKQKQVGWGQMVEKSLLSHLVISHKTIQNQNDGEHIKLF